MSAALRGLIFDIRRFSTHDGAGIRTTVFLKGCPLRCVWCQNPEGIAPEPRLAHFAPRCILCGLCLGIGDRATAVEGGRIVLQAERAAHPELYEAVCPTGALRLDSRWYTLAALRQLLRRDQVFFRQGGGVTLSGGEPFFQAEFAAALLRALREEGIHTAVESSLFVEWRSIERALPYIDTLFADFKIADSRQHRRAAGAGNERIADNLRRLLHSPYRDRVIVRTPLIPEFTATEQNLTAIAAQLAAWYPETRYELLNYNPLAQAKYAHMPYAYCFSDNPPLYTNAQLELFRRMVRRAGIKNLLEDS